MCRDNRVNWNLSAVLVCYFVKVMDNAGAVLVADAGVDFELLKPLIELTTIKVSEMNDPRLAQTGPAIRGDQSTMDRHIEMLQNDDLKDIYKTISRYIWETSKRI